MTSLQRLKDLRGRPFSRYDGRLKAVTFESDTVIPAKAVMETLSGADTECGIRDTRVLMSHAFGSCRG